MTDSIAAELDAEALAERTRNDELFAEWLAARGTYFHPEPGTSLEQEAAHDRRLEQLARTIAVTPTADPRQTVRKLEILEQELHDLEAPAGRADLVMLAGIKSDLLGLAAR